MASSTRGPAVWRAACGSCGVGPESRVGDLRQRSPELIVGMLAVRKAGGAYVPLDPGYPAERVSLILEDSGAVARLGDPGGGDLADAPGPALAGRGD